MDHTTNNELRIGIVRFLNALPLVYGLEKKDDITISPFVPAQLAEQLSSGNVEIALVPSIDYQKTRTID